MKSHIRIRILTAMCAVSALFVTACESKQQANAVTVAAVSKQAGSITGRAYEADVVSGIRAAMKSPELASRIVSGEQAAALVDKWLPIPHDAGWVTAQPDQVRDLYLDAARLQELGYSVSAEALARNANALHGSQVTEVGRAMESAYADMYAPSAAESTDATDAQFDADLKRFWEQRKAIESLLAPISEKYRGVAELTAIGRLYRDPVATAAAPGLEGRLSPGDLDRYAQALRLAAELAPGPQEDAP